LKYKKTSRKKVLQALKNESEAADLAMIRRWQALPMDRRTSFLLKKIGPTRYTL
jgi:hypothetical protein